jgi:hypothetical protein
MIDAATTHAIMITLADRTQTLDCRLGVGERGVFGPVGPSVIEIQASG